MTMIISDSGVQFADATVQPTALTTGAQTIAGNKTFSGNVTVSGVLTGSTIVSGTAQNTTSGTAIDFTGIPSGVKRVTVMLNGVSTNGSANPMMQIGTSGGIESSGYVSASSSGTFTAGFGVGFGTAAASVLNGVFTLVHMGGNVWVYSGTPSYSAVAAAAGGVKQLSGVLDRIRLTTTNGTDTFDAGSMNILYER